jgi:hypothetical protein
VHVHANALLTGTGTTSIVLADLRDPEAILAYPKIRDLIDFNQPVALLLVAILHFITDKENPARIIAAFRDALPAGSYLALSHATADFRPAVAQTAAVYDQATSQVAPALPPEITNIWTMSTWGSGDGFRWPTDGGWTRFTRVAQT